MENKEKKKKSKWNIVLKVLIVILAILIILEIATGLVSKGMNNVKHAFFRVVGIETKEGNSIGNINNYGYIAEDSNYLYYMCPSENGQFVGISKVSKKDLAGPQTRLIEGTWEMTSINSYGDYIYFVTFSQNEVDANTANVDEVDNKIHRVSKNGNQKDEILNDNEFHNYAYKMTVVGGKIYYIGEDECIWYMDLNGKNKTRLNENATGFEAINDKYILYNMLEVKDGEETSVSYIMDRNGKNARQINGERIFTPIIYQDAIYYVTEDRYLHKMDIDGKNDIMLSNSKIYNLNVSDNGVFYLNYVYSSSGEIEALAVYRMDLDGKNNKILYTLEEDSNSVCVTKDWVFFLDSNDQQGMMEIISPDGKQKINLFTLNYADYYYLDELIEERRNSTADEAIDSKEVTDNTNANTEISE